MKNILITGAAGYIGSICTYRLLKEGFQVFAFDNLSTGHIETIKKLKQFGNLNFIKGDLKNSCDIEEVFNKNTIDAVAHFAASSQIYESQIKPLEYYKNNVSGSINLIKSMIENNIKYIVFSSSAAVYGNSAIIPIKENQAKNPINTYGKTKLIVEEILKDCADIINSASLRYFNVCGASNNLFFGENHTPETHLIPNILNGNSFKLYGCDYNTIDGTCIRDYVDVEDIVDAHISALKYIFKNNKSIDVNLGSAKGTSVKEIIKICEKVTGDKIDFEIMPKRTGDCEILIADNTYAKEILNWTPKIPIKKSIEKAYEYKKRCS